MVIIRIATKTTPVHAVPGLRTSILGEIKESADIKALNVTAEQDGMIWQACIMDTLQMGWVKESDIRPVNVTAPAKNGD